MACLLPSDAARDVGWARRLAVANPQRWLSVHVAPLHEGQRDSSPGARHDHGASSQRLFRSWRAKRPRRTGGALRGRVFSRTRSIRSPRHAARYHPWRPPGRALHRRAAAQRGRAAQHARAPAIRPGRWRPINRRGIFSRRAAATQGSVCPPLPPGDLRVALAWQVVPGLVAEGQVLFIQRQGCAGQRVAELLGRLAPTIAAVMPGCASVHASATWFSGFSRAAKASPSPVTTSKIVSVQ